MAYSTPITAVSSATFTAAQFNQSVRDNILVTPAALATTAGRIFVATGANAIAERAIEPATVATQQSTSSTSFTDLTTAGPAVTLTTGTKAIALISSAISLDTLGVRGYVGVAVSGATTVAAADADALRYQAYAINADHRGSLVVTFSSLTAGSNTFTLKYRVSSGAASATFANRTLTVIGL